MVGCSSGFFSAHFFVVNIYWMTDRSQSQSSNSLSRFPYFSLQYLSFFTIIFECWKRKWSHHLNNKHFKIQKNFLLCCYYFGRKIVIQSARKSKQTKLFEPEFSSLTRSSWVGFSVSKDFTVGKKVILDDNWSIKSVCCRLWRWRWAVNYLKSLTPIWFAHI